MNRIRYLREQRKMTQSELGKLLNVKDAAISKYETEKVPLTAETIVKLSKIFNVSTDYILGISSTCDTNATLIDAQSQDICLRLQHLLSEDSIADVEIYAACSNIPKDTMNKYVNGDLCPTAYDLCKLIETFDTTADYLFGKSDIPHPSKNNIIGHDILCGRLQQEMDGKFMLTEMAEKLDVPISTIKEILSGELAPTQKMLYGISQLLHKSTDYLLGISNISRNKDELGEYPFRFDVAVAERIASSMEIYEKSDEVWSYFLPISEEEVYLLKNYGFLIHLSVLLKISEILHVSLDYLLNRTESKLTLQLEEERLVRAYRSLNEDNQSILLGDALKAVKDQETQNYLRSQSVAADCTAEMIDQGKSLA